jgi:uncharacterized damage-inducible protein DinB
LSTFEKDYLTIAIGQFKHFKERAEKGIKQLSDEELFWKPSEESNSIAILIKHISGNMHSRWVNFLTTDGEKAFRDRDMEFVDENETKEMLLNKWESGWKLLFETLEYLEEADLNKIVTLRKQPLSVLQAIQSEIAHISYHLGQILYIGKQIKDKEWEILSIPKNGSNEFNKKNGRET